MEKNLTYKDSGVDYNVMDAFKLCAQKLAIETHQNLSGSNISVVLKSIGESATVFDNGADLLAFVEEGLGTKNKVVEAMEAKIVEMKKILELAAYIEGGRDPGDARLGCSSKIVYNVKVKT